MFGFGVSLHRRCCLFGNKIPGYRNPRLSLLYENDGKNFEKSNYHHHYETHNKTFENNANNNHNNMILISFAVVSRIAVNS
ncbi:hypothetical protein DERP_013231 [Dermatophagoides pteronyssinus]|uniref:Uncharacterized protein n=1 Tax=Dermatophagoides pteronyssinus TaxID=6956 RepID=A0ABQ8IRR3_DERPT|nr:hypothetical protein DERP_013231 [Dermatophagoides pteronyssinus]